MGSEARVSPVDVRIRVVAAALQPGIALARAMALPLDDLEEIVATAYFEEARARGWSMRAIARRFGKSLRSITTLSQRAKAGPDLLGKSAEIGRRRRAIAWIGAHPGASREALARAIGGDRAAIDETIAQLVHEGTLEEREGALTVAASHVDLVKEDVAHRIDALRHFLDAVTLVVHRRFFATHQPGAAYARVITFSAPRADVEAIWSEAFARLHQSAVDSDARSASGDAVQVSAAICLAEVPIERTREE